MSAVLIMQDSIDANSHLEDSTKRKDIKVMLAWSVVLLLHYELCVINILAINFDSNNGQILSK